MLSYTVIQFPNICYDIMIHLLCRYLLCYDISAMIYPPLTWNSGHSRKIDLFYLSEMGIHLHHLLPLVLFLVFFSFWCKCYATLPHLLFLYSYLARIVTLSFVFSIPMYGMWSCFNISYLKFLGMTSLLLLNITLLMIDNSSLYDQYCFNSLFPSSFLLGQPFWVFSSSSDNTQSSPFDLLISSRFVPITWLLLHTMWIWAANSSSDISGSVSFREALDSTSANTRFVW